MRDSSPISQCPQPLDTRQERVAAAMASEEVALRIAQRLKEERAKLEERVMRQVRTVGSCVGITTDAAMDGQLRPSSCAALLPCFGCW